MDVTTALLCDHAQVRDGLLFVLSGGITRIRRESFPALIGAWSALMIELDRIEAERAHQLEIVVIGEDGEEITRMQAELQIGATDGVKPGESIAVPFAVDLNVVPIPTSGAYEIRVYLDGALQRTTQFWAEPMPTIDV